MGNQPFAIKETWVVEMDAVEPIINTFAALADRGRFRMILALASTVERSVGELAEDLAVPTPAVSQHLAILKLNGLVNSRRRGRRVFYRMGVGIVVEGRTLVIRVPRGEVRLDLGSPQVDGCGAAAAAVVQPTRLLR
jgi:DNA-binding transcriptional ArsR family regulator